MDKIVLWGKQYFGNHLLRQSLRPKYNLGKTLHSTMGHFPLPTGPFEVWQLDFIQLPPSQGCKYILVIDCVYSHWVEAFPC